MMKKNALIIAGAGLIASFSPVALAEYNASIALGYVSATGNTETTTFNTEMLLTVNTENWTHNGKFQALGSSEDEQTSAERYYLEEKSDYNMDETQYLYGKGTHNDDRFSSFEYQTSFSAGYGRHLYTTETMSVEGYGGIGYRINDIVGIGVEEDAIFALGESLAWQLSESTRVTQSFDTEIGDITVTQFEVGLESMIVGSIATKISFQARHTSEVLPGLDKMDTQTSISLVYEF